MPRVLVTRGILRYCGPMRMRIVTDVPGFTPTVTAAVVEEAPPVEDVAADVEHWHTVMAVEEVWSGDGRFHESGSFTWIDPPFPFMADDENNERHLNAKLVGNVVRAERIGTEIHGWVRKVNAANAGPDAERVAHLQAMIDNGELRGVSYDADSPELTVEFPAMEDADADLNEPADGEPMRMEVNADTMPREVYHSLRLIGATALPFPAFQEAYVENVGAAVASAGPLTGLIVSTSPEPSLVAAGLPVGPELPPRSAFDNPNLTELTPPTVTSDGRFYGHLAGWGTCHIGYTDRCVTPPRTASSYAHFHTGEVLCADGSRVATGTITMDGGHAPLSAGAAAAAAHYDDTTWGVADVVMGEDDHGIWFAGALRPELGAARTRRLMASDLSGDWRRIGQGLELIAALAVNVPGFPKPRVSMRETDGLVASFVAQLPVIPHRRTAPVMRYDPHVAARIRKSIRRDERRAAELRRRVHGGRS